MAVTTEARIAEGIVREVTRLRYRSEFREMTDASRPTPTHESVASQVVSQAASRSL